MSVSTPPPPAPPKKKGMGCCGCGCAILVLLALLFFGLIATGGYLAYHKMLQASSPTPAVVQSFNGDDDMFNGARQKLVDFDHDLKNHQPATIQLSADEINTLIARNPDFKNARIALFVTMTNDQARLQASVPSSLVTWSTISNRYFNADVSFGLDFDSSAHTLNLLLQNLRVGDYAPSADKLPLIQNQLNPALNQMLQNQPEGKNLLEEAKSIRIENGELVIETQ